MMRQPTTRTHEHDRPQDAADIMPQTQQHQPPHKVPTMRPQLTTILKPRVTALRGQHALGPAQHGLPRQRGQRCERLREHALRVHATAHHGGDARHLLHRL